MGALHAGHESLIRAANAETDFVVVSIFVNPMQFGPSEDLAKYPRPLERDLAICAQHDVSLVFHPEVAAIYPPAFRTQVEVTQLQDVLCGASRPGHFRGVATVVLKLFNIVQPDFAFFGLKDAQQVRLLQQMAADLDLQVRIVVCPIVREADGLALSSRNQYLNARQRSQAVVISQGLRQVEESVGRGERRADELIRLFKNQISKAEEAHLDYVAVVDASTLQPIDCLKGRVLVAVAAHFGNTRLIDNVQLEVHD
jgi:pantoate--beta-alanine ligase